MSGSVLVENVVWLLGIEMKKECDTLNNNADAMPTFVDLTDLSVEWKASSFSTH